MTTVPGCIGEISSEAGNGVYIYSTKCPWVEEGSCCAAHYYDEGTEDQWCQYCGEINVTRSGIAVVCREELAVTDHG